MPTPATCRPPLASLFDSSREMPLDLAAGSVARPIRVGELPHGPANNGLDGALREIVDPTPLFVYPLAVKGVQEPDQLGGAAVGIEPAAGTVELVPSPVQALKAPPLEVQAVGERPRDALRVKGQRLSTDLSAFSISRATISAHSSVYLTSRAPSWVRLSNMPPSISSQKYSK